MDPTRTVAVALALLLASLASPAPSAEEVAIAFDQAGLSSLRWRGLEFLQRGAPSVSSVVLETVTVEAGSEAAGQGAPGSTGREGHEFTQVAAGTEPTVSVNGGANRVHYDYDWGAATFDYAPAEDRLDLTLTLTNRSQRTLADFTISPLALVFPERLDVGRHWHRQVALPGDAGVVEAPFGEHKLVLACASMTPLRLGFGKPDKDGTRVDLSLRGGQALMEPGGVRFHPLGLPRIPPGESLTIPLALHFADRDGDGVEIAATAVAAFREYHAPTLEWEDRRPIGAIFLGKGRGPEQNPRNWFGDQEIDIRTEDGLARLRAKMMEHADRCIEACTEVGAQGVVVWDPEGGEFPHPITYIGDPRMVPLLAPEMVGIYPDYFARFRAAGLRTGVCIRPTQVYFDDDKQTWQHGTGSHGPERNPLDDDFSDIWPENLPWFDFYPVVERMSRKIAYAKEHWGCTLFYVDTNGLHHRYGQEGKFRWTLMDVHVWRDLQDRHPDVLLIPEFATQPGQLAYTAPYLQPPYSPPVTREWWRALLPRAFSVSHTVNLDQAKWDAYRNELVDGIANGDSLFFRGWFNDGYNAQIREVYREVYREKAVNPWSD